MEKEKRLTEEGTSSVAGVASQSIKSEQKDTPMKKRKFRYAHRYQ
jgi:hypothetical protein